MEIVYEVSVEVLEISEGVYAFACTEETEVQAAIEWLD